jgi:hypothetical protein
VSSSWTLSQYKTVLCTLYKKVVDFSVPRRDVTNQTLPGRAGKIDKLFTLKVNMILALQSTYSYSLLIVFLFNLTLSFPLKAEYDLSDFNFLYLYFY